MAMPPIRLRTCYSSLRSENQFKLVTRKKVRVSVTEVLCILKDVYLKDAGDTNTASRAYRSARQGCSRDDASGQPCAGAIVTKFTSRLKYAALSPLHFNIARVYSQPVH